MMLSTEQRCTPSDSCLYLNRIEKWSDRDLWFVFIAILKIGSKENWNAKKILSRPYDVHAFLVAFYRLVLSHKCGFIGGRAVGDGIHPTGGILQPKCEYPPICHWPYVAVPARWLLPRAKYQSRKLDRWQ